MTKKIKKNIYFKFYQSVSPKNIFKTKVISSINMSEDYRRTVFRKKRKKRFYNILNYGYSKYIGEMLRLEVLLKKEKRLLKKVKFEEKWLNYFVENKIEEAIYLIESLTIMENIGLEDKDYLLYLEELKDEIDKCPCISREQKIYLLKKYANNL